MAFKDYENLDATKETATEEEIERLKKKYEVDQGYYLKVGTRRILKCLAIASILTVVTMLLYSNIITVDFITAMAFSFVYFVMFFIGILDIYVILLKRRNIKEEIWLLISIVSILISITTLIIGILAPISSILKAICLIITAITFIVFMLLMVVGRILGIGWK